MDFSNYTRHTQELVPSKNVWELFEKQQIPKIYSQHQMIYYQGDQAETFHYLKKGRVKVFLTSENGSEKTLTILESGNIFGEAAFFDGLPRVSSAKTLIKSEIISINRQTLMDYFSREPSLAMSMLQYLARTVRMLSAQVDNMTFLQADKRIAQLLVNACAKSADPHPVVPCTHEEIGELIGASRVTVSKILNGFVKRGWLATRYRSVEIQDVKSLTLFAFSETDD